MMISEIRLQRFRSWRLLEFAAELDDTSTYDWSDKAGNCNSYCWEMIRCRDYCMMNNSSSSAIAAVLRWSKSCTRSSCTNSCCCWLRAPKVTLSCARTGRERWFYSHDSVWFHATATTIFRRRQSIDLSTSERARDSPARGRAGHRAISGASERSSNYDNRSFVHLSFVRSFGRSGATADHLGWKKKELDPGPKSCIERLGTWVKPAARRIGLGVFFSPLFLLPPATLAPHPTPWDLGKFTHFPSPFCSSPSISTQPPSLHSHPSLVPISFVYMLYSFFWQKFRFGQVCHIDIPKSMLCFGEIL